MSSQMRLNKTAEAYDSRVRGIAIPRERSPQKRGAVTLPANTTVVSVDNHWSVHTDIFFERFPAHLRDKAPRLYIPEDGNHIWLVDGKSPLTEGIKKTQATFESVPGCYSIEPRLRDLDVEGIDKEIVFPNSIAQYYSHPDLEVREWIFRIHNQHMSEMQKAAPGRFYGTGLINFWDMARVRESVAELMSMGLKTIILPQHPKHANGVPLNYCLPEMDPLWAVIQDANIPICFHVGEFFKDGPGGHGTTVMVDFGPYRKTFGELVFGGVFDRFPKLQVVFMEAEINWVPAALQTASMAFDCFRDMLEPQIKHHPRHYWFNNCYAALMHDPLGLRLLDLVGADRVMWSADYPHPESTFGYSWDAMSEVLGAVSDDDEARAILGGNAMRVFKLD